MRKKENRMNMGKLYGPKTAMTNRGADYGSVFTTTMGVEVRPEQTAPQIAVELEQLHKAIAHLPHQVHSLFEKIEPIRGPENRKVLSALGDVARPPMSPL